MPTVPTSGRPPIKTSALVVIGLILLVLIILLVILAANLHDYQRASAPTIHAVGSANHSGSSPSIPSFQAIWLEDYGAFSDTSETYL